ncbi:DUF4123 domain-containing protein [Pseudomonas sp. B21-056]|uniref:DUF4123 domain-containing protein n=1 Tax=Pseudomonas sp. B21-056 TaxID=2895495 RepID=UPI002230C9F9|nr:DUF4123 domain-containing protein [Pseudomonas sp. B21-056]UZE23590.1 DUF4123 domain-containing protein [Pseudomonas sp. B21-056]
MSPTALQWLQHLYAQAKACGLAHVDLLINCALLDYPLLRRLNELVPSPRYRLLLQDSPERAFADQGPVLVRVLLFNTAQRAWLMDFLQACHGHSRVLVLLSRWSFDALGERLGRCTQAEWEQGRKSGVLRYYDTRLFRLLCELLDPDQRKMLHEGVIEWQWIDRDGKACQMAGFDVRQGEAGRGAPALRLSDEQVTEVGALGDAQQWCARQEVFPGSYGFESFETFVYQVFRAHVDAERQQFTAMAREQFLQEWLVTCAGQANGERGISQ